MSRQRFGLLVIAALVVIAGALLVSSRRNANPAAPGIALLPALGANMNAVTAVIMRKGSATPTLTVHQVASGWVVAERGDYPADLPKLRTLLTGLRDARIVEEKTSDPAHFAAIGVEDPASPSAPGALVTVVMPQARLGVIVGKSVGSGNFVRRDGENRSFSVEPAITLETEPKFWIDPRLIDVQSALIQSIDVKPTTGPGYALHRLNPADNTFSLEGVPAGRKALDGHALAPTQSLLTTLNAEDVAPLADVDFSAPAHVTVTLTDGNVLSLVGAVKADKHWLQVAATKDAALTAKAQTRAYEIASYRYDALFKPLEQLLEPLPTKATPGGAQNRAAKPAAAPPVLPAGAKAKARATAKPGVATPGVATPGAATPIPSPAPATP